MKIVFFGTDEFAKEILSYLLGQGLDIVAVVTRADKPKGRSLKMEAPPVKELCLEKGFQGPIYQPLKASDVEFVSLLKQLDSDLFVVVSYGQILRQNVLDIPKYGTINVHPSLLPKYRGPSPIQSVVLAGEAKTGVTIMEMELAMDAGGIIKVVPVDISEEITFGELEILLVDLAKDSLFKVIQEISKNQKISATPQVENLATYTKKIHAEDSFIDWNRSVKEICNFVRGMNPRPGARMTVQVDGKNLLMKVFKVKGTEGAGYHGGKPGEPLFFNKEHGLIIACSDGSVSLQEVQLEGKKKMNIKDFINGFSDKINFIY